MNTPVNQTIEITSVAFNRAPRATGMEAFPRRMIWDDREYNFVETGMHYLVQKGQELIRLFDVSDGQSDFRLRLDQQNHWTLVSMRAAA